MGEWKHRLTEIDPVSKTAVCAVDGPVDIYYYARADGGRTMRCKEVRKDTPIKPGRHQMISRDEESGNGVCNVCGQVKMTLKRGTWGCPSRGYKGEHLKMKTELRRAIKEGRPCEICGVVTESMALDHKHGEKTWRGVLCMKHNTGLGMFDDDPELLVKAAEYLRKHE